MSTSASPEFPELLREKLGGLVELSREQIRALQTHYELLRRWNRALNLTAIDSLEKAVERHYCESLFLGASLPREPLRIVDVGSGAGFPGIPVAVLRPDCSVTLIEAHARKAVFLRQAVRQLGGFAGNCVVVAKRSEMVVKEPGFQSLDCVISRAVSYEDLAPVVRRLAKSAYLLTGADAPPDSLRFTWNSPLKLPWGDQKFLWMGVSRGT